MLRHPLAVALLLAVFLPLGCVQDINSESPVGAGSPRIRVLLIETGGISLQGGEGSEVTFDQSRQAPIALPFRSETQLQLAGNDWRLGGSAIGGGSLTIRPGALGGLRVNGTLYRGYLKLVPVAYGKFDVINNVDIEDYLKSVVTSEMYRDWPLEALKSQAVCSRTYALYEVHTAGMSRAWDVYSDERSQVYGGVDRETSGGREAAAGTAGVVLTYGPGEGKIFKAYFSSCCGGITQAAADAFPGDPYVQPLAEHYNGPCCMESKYFNWGPIVIQKAELARRFREWADRHGRAVGRALPESGILGIYRIDVQGVNRYGRPNRVLITDTRGIQYSWPAEQLRSAVNTDPRGGATIPSSFCKINSDPGGSSITFYEGHGFGHGVGMCQWCAEGKAAQGARCEQILASAFPGAKLVRAY